MTLEEADYAYLPMVPDVVGPDSPLDANGYPRATEDAGTLYWPPVTPDAVVDVTVRVGRMTFTIQRADPDLAAVPVCILTDAEYGAIGGSTLTPTQPDDPGGDPDPGWTPPGDFPLDPFPRGWPTDADSSTHDASNWDAENEG